MIKNRLDHIEALLEKLIISQQKTDEQLRKTGEQLQKTDEKLKNIGTQLANMGFVQGEVAEDLFYRNVKPLFSKRNKRFDRVWRNMKKKGIGEFDIVAVNGAEVLVIEVKNKLSSRMVDDFVDDQLPRFKKVFSEYEDYKILGGIGSLVVKDDVERYAEDRGLYVLTQSSDGGAEIVNEKNFVARVF